MMYGDEGRAFSAARAEKRARAEVAAHKDDSCQSRSTLRQEPRDAQGTWEAAGMARAARKRQARALGSAVRRTRMQRARPTRGVLLRWA